MCQACVSKQIIVDRTVALNNKAKFPVVLCANPGVVVTVVPVVWLVDMERIESDPTGSVVELSFVNIVASAIVESIEAAVEIDAGLVVVIGDVLSVFDVASALGLDGADCEPLPEEFDIGGIAGGGG